MKTQRINHLWRMLGLLAVLMFISSFAFGQGVIPTKDNVKLSMAFEGGKLVEKSCECGGDSYACICKIIVIFNRGEGDIRKANYHILNIASYKIERNTLRMTFEEKLPKLKSSVINQKEEVPLDPEIARSMGYRSIKILAGIYEIRNSNSITVNVKLQPLEPDSSGNDDVWKIKKPKP